MSPIPAEDLRGVFIDLDGTRTELDDAQCDDIRRRLRLIKGGLDGTPSDPLITTGQAAEIIGVSRRTVTRFMDAGDLPFVRHGCGHRRARMSDVLSFKERYDRQTENIELIREIIYGSELGDLDTIDGYLSQFDEPAQAAQA